jgi:hypothetical protein
MSLMDYLKRIEEKHSGTVHSDTLTVCDFCHRRHPCDVVKLARALQWIADGDDTGPEHEAFYAAAEMAERVLKEVAGE